MPQHSEPTVLIVDIGGTRVKLSHGGGTGRAEFESSSELTPHLLMTRVKELTADWSYDVVALGYPGQVGSNGPVKEPGNVGDGWVGFDFEKAFGKPTRVINDAVMQALGAFRGGRMLFIGLGTGVGSALITERIAIPLELGDLPFGDKTLMTTIGKRALDEGGEETWQRNVQRILPALRRSFLANYLVVGGGHATKVNPLPPHVQLGSNDDAIEGGRRVWREAVDPHERTALPFWKVAE